MEKQKTHGLWSLEHILKNSIYGGAVTIRFSEMDTDIAEKINHDIKIESDLVKHGHLDNQQPKRK